MSCKRGPALRPAIEPTPRVRSGGVACRVQGAAGLGGAPRDREADDHGVQAGLWEVTLCKQPSPTRPLSGASRGRSRAGRVFPPPQRAHHARPSDAVRCGAICTSPAARCTDRFAGMRVRSAAGALSRSRRDPQSHNAHERSSPTRAAPVGTPTAPDSI